jgi:hypothetical protein
MDLLDEMPNCPYLNYATLQHTTQHNVIYSFRYQPFTYICIRNEAKVTLKKPFNKRNDRPISLLDQPRIQIPALRYLPLGEATWNAFFKTVPGKTHKSYFVTGRNMVTSFALCE